MAAVNFDAALNNTLNNVRSILRGEAPGSLSFLALAMLTLGVWVAVSWVGGWTDAASAALTSQEVRYRTLSMLAAEYKAMAPQAGAVRENVDVQAVFAQVSERMELGPRAGRMTADPSGRTCNVDIQRLYAEELTELGRQLAARGVRFLSAEIRALPAGGERLLTLSAVIGPMAEEGSR